MSTLLDTASLIVTPNAYKAGKLYSVVPSNGDGDFTATRATTATRVNSEGLVESVASNIPRLDYSLGSCPNLLLEPQRTNLALNSNNLNSWNVVGSALQLNSTTSPSGNTDASKLVPTTSNGYIASTISTIASATYVFSVYVKSATGSNVNSNIHAVNASITTNFTATNDWQRISIVFTSTSTSTPVYIGGFSSLSTGEDLFIWGAQLEAGAYPTSYIPTTSASVTRNADVISKTGISSLIGQTEGTMFVDFIYDYSETASSEAISISDGTTANRIFLGNILSNTFSVAVTTSSVLQFTSATSYSLVVGQRYKVAIAYKANDFAFYVNGVQISSGTSGSVPATSRLAFDSGFGGSNFFKPTNAVSLFPTRLTNTQCIELTTL